MNLEALISEARSRVYVRANMSEVVEASREEIADLVVERVQTALEQAILGAQSILRSTSQEYVEALYIAENLTIAIKPEAEYLEYGYGPREQLHDLLASPKAQPSKDGGKYVVVPIGDKRPSDIAAAIQKKTSELLSKGGKSKASKRTLDQVVKDMQSLVRRSSSAPSTARSANEEAFRTASSKQDPADSWVHPGFQGVNQLEFINTQLRIALLEGTVRILELNASRPR